MTFELRFERDGGDRYVFIWLDSVFGRGSIREEYVVCLMGIKG